MVKEASSTTVSRSGYPLTPAGWQRSVCRTTTVAASVKLIQPVLGITEHTYYRCPTAVTSTAGTEGDAQAPRKTMSGARARERGA